MHVFYLHGFASSPASGKAAGFAARLAAHGLTLHCPDFNEPEFASLTVTRMIGQVEDAIRRLPAGPVALIGSSLGAFVAVLVAAREARDRAVIERLVLLAPALDFGSAGLRELGPDGLARWRNSDRLDVFHYALGKVVPLRYAFHEDAGRHDALSAPLDVPVLIFQGTRDAVVDPAMVERYARGRTNVDLRLVDDDHQLAGSLPVILEAVEGFLGLGR
jgi:pimeloyl-ACP methyl ester carboxylesterase